MVDVKLLCEIDWGWTKKDSDGAHKVGYAGCFILARKQVSWGKDFQKLRWPSRRLTTNSDWKWIVPRFVYLPFKALQNAEFNCSNDLQFNVSLVL